MYLYSKIYIAYLHEGLTKDAVDPTKPWSTRMVLMPGEYRGKEGPRSSVVGCKQPIPESWASNSEIRTGEQPGHNVQQSEDQMEHSNHEYKH